MHCCSAECSFAVESYTKNRRSDALICEMEVSQGLPNPTNPRFITYGVELGPPSPLINDLLETHEGHNPRRKRWSREVIKIEYVAKKSSKRQFRLKNSKCNYRDSASCTDGKHLVARVTVTRDL